MDRLVRRNVLALSGRAVEASGDVDVLLLDKTGTITLGNRQAAEFIADARRRRGRAGRGGADVLARRRDARGPLDRRARQAVRASASTTSPRTSAHFVPFTAQTRMSGVDFNGTRLRKGAGDAIVALGRRRGRPGAGRAARRRSTGSPARAARRWPSPATARCSASSTSRTSSRRACAHRFDQLRAMGIRTVMVTGDNRLTAAKIAEEAGRRRLPRRGDAGAQARADQGAAGRRAGWSR